MDNTTTNVQGREIKFRAWTGEQMYNDPYHYEPNYLSDSPMPYRFYEDWRDLEDGRSKPCILMQFTGLRDKSGKEIYEGDVDSHGRYIEYRDGGFHVVQGNGQTYDYLCHMKHIEIVGNIYEPLPEPPTEGIIAEGLIDHGV